MNESDKKKLTICIVLFFVAMFLCVGIIMFSVIYNGFFQPDPELNIAPTLKIIVICGVLFAVCSAVLGAVSVKIKKAAGIAMYVVAAWNFICSVGIYVAVFALKLIPV